jgi:hypothetical protein
MVISETLDINIAGVLTDADTIAVSACAPTATATVTHIGTGQYRVTISDADAGVTYLVTGTLTLPDSATEYPWSTTLVAASAAGMGIIECRTLVRRYAKEAGSSAVYSDADIDSAIEFVGTRFCRMTHYLQGTGTIALTAASASADATLLTTFKPERLLYALCSTAYAPMEVIPYPQLWTMARQSQSGIPQYLAFSSETAGAVYPTPSANATITVAFWEMFTVATPNLPRHVLIEAIPCGATAILQHSNPEMAYASASWAQYLAVEASYIGANSRGAHVVGMVRDGEG